MKKCSTAVEAATGVASKTGMTARENEFGQPIGAALPGWKPVPRPPRDPLVGRACAIEALVPARHAAALHAAFAEDKTGESWTYLSYGPFPKRSAFEQWLVATCLGDDPLFHAVLDRPGGTAIGMASYLRIDPPAGVIEIGHIHFAPRLQRTLAATEALYLMMRRVFEELGYRRYEWKCDALNAPSRRAALRLGFAFEGIFRQATVYRGRNRDTAWYSIIDGDWPALKRAYENWLDPANFDAAGGQRRRLAALIAAERGAPPA